MVNGLANDASLHELPKEHKHQGLQFVLPKYDPAVARYHADRVLLV